MRGVEGRVLHLTDDDRVLLDELDGERDAGSGRSLPAAEGPLELMTDRLAFEDEAIRHLAFARRLGHPLCLALISFDLIDEPNVAQQPGDADEMLERATTRWRMVLRTEDIACRWGFDECALLLPNCTTVSAVQLCWRLREETPAGHSFSAGLASFQGEESWEELVERAEDCVEQARAKGRGRTVAEGLVDLD